MELREYKYREYTSKQEGTIKKSTTNNNIDRQHPQQQEQYNNNGINNNNENNNTFHSRNNPSNSSYLYMKGSSPSIVHLDMSTFWNLQEQDWNLCDRQTLLSCHDRTPCLSHLHSCFLMDLSISLQINITGSALPSRYTTCVLNFIIDSFSKNAFEIKNFFMRNKSFE